MDRIKNYKEGFVGIFFTAALVFTASQCFSAVTNGFFESTLSGWQYNDSTGVVWSSESLLADGTGSALLQESGNLQSSILSQTFYIDPGSETLTFSVRTPLYGEGETDLFWIDIFDQDNNQFSLFEWNSAAGEYIPPEPYFTSAEIGNHWFYDFIVPVDSWDSENITLRFKLDHELDDDIYTSVLVDNVVLHGSPSTPPVVPAPGAMGLALVGLAALGVLKKQA